MRAYLASGLATALLLTLLLPSAQAADAPPQDVNLDWLGDAIRVSWVPPAEGDVSHYLVQRMTSEGLAPPVQVPGTETVYIDELQITDIVAAAYQVTAVFTDGSSSSASAGAIFLDDIIGDGGGGGGGFDDECWRVDDQGIFLDGGCLVNWTVAPLPDQYEDTVRGPLMGAWTLVAPGVYLLCDLISEVIDQVTPDGGLAP